MLSDDKDTFLVERDGKPVGTWPGSSYLGETYDFQVLRGDLDGDRRPELIVANHDSTSAGMGVSRWTIFIFADTDFRSFNSPLSFGVEEYGAFGTFVTAGRGVNILTTRWMERKGKGKRGTGLYLVGQWWRYRSGQLFPLPNHPRVARRYLASFEQERLRTLTSAQIPQQWFNNPTIERLNADPSLDVKKQTETRGTIETVSVRNIDSDRVMKLSFKPNEGVAHTYVYAHDKFDQGELDLRFIGDAATGRIYPERYLPSNAEEWLTGRRATVSHYGDGSTHTDVFAILWLDPKSGKR
jgi:hypothetical protein